MIEALAFVIFVAGIFQVIIWSVKNDPERPFGKKKLIASLRQKIRKPHA